MSSGMENAQNFAAIISSMVLEPSFFDIFWSLDFPGMFSQKRGTWQGWRRRRGRRRPPVWGPRPQKYKNMDFGGLGVGGGPPPLIPCIPIGPCSLVTPEQPP